MGMSQPKQNPAFMQTMLNDISGTSNVQAPTINAAPVAGSNQILRQASKDESLLPSYLQMNSSNPLYAPNAGQQAANQYFQQAIQPQLGAAAEQQYLGGNLGNNGSSSFGANYMGNLAATGANQSFFAGQNYLNNEIQNQLAARQSYFGNEVGLNQGQDNLMSGEQQQANMQNASNSLSSQEFNAGYPLAQGALASQDQNQLYNQGLNYDIANSQNMGNFMSGGLGSIFGLGNIFMGTQAGRNLGQNVSNGLGSAFPSIFGSSFPGSGLLMGGTQPITY
jgi:hypothetical protein